MKEIVNKSANEQLKYEIAKELGIEIPWNGHSYDWKMVPSYYCGLIGGEIFKRTTQAK